MTNNLLLPPVHSAMVAHLMCRIVRPMIHVGVLHLTCLLLIPLVPLPLIHICPHMFSEVLGMALKPCGMQYLKQSSGIASKAVVSPESNVPTSVRFAHNRGTSMSIAMSLTLHASLVHAIFWIPTDITNCTHAPWTSHFWIARSQRRLQDAVGIRWSVEVPF